MAGRKRSLGISRKNRGELIPGSESSSFSSDAEVDRPRPIGRAWSPSVPLRDSSPDGEQKNYRVEATLSTFTPTRHLNVFHLSQDEISSVLGPTSARGTLIALSVEKTLCIGGAYLLTVLGGTVSLLGTFIGFSKKSHRVYAPKSSPVPVLEAVASEPSSGWSEELSRLLEIDGTSCAIILIQELRTGIEGLGNVCKVFSDVFDYESQSEEDAKMLNVPGAYMVGSILLSFCRVS